VIAAKGAALLVAGAVLLGLGSSIAAASVGYPPPSSDPFYAPPPGYAATPDGAVLRARPVVATLLSVPLAVDAWQLLFRSTDAAGGPTAEVVTVMVPRNPWSGPGARPIVSYQPAEDSVGSECAPSYVLRAGLAGITSNVAPEVALMTTLLLRGWAVIATDYEGPSSEFLAAGQEAHAVLDGIRAAQSYGPDGLRTENPLALWGYSGGAFATAWASEIQPRYAPDMRLVGIAIGGTPAQLAPAMETVDGSYGAGLVFGAMIGLDRAFPSSFAGLFTAAGAQKLAASASDCTDQLLLTYAFQHLSGDTVSPHPFDDASLRALLAANSPYGHGAPEVPVYDYHATDDEFVPVSTDDALVAGYCGAGTPVETVRYGVGDHNSTLLTGAPGAEAFLAGRFARRPAINDCPPGSAKAGAPRRRGPAVRQPPSRRRRRRPARRHRQPTRS
jgi:hypothetical protein